MDFKQLIIEKLDVLRGNEIKQKQPFKARAYQKVINALKARDKPVVTIEDVKDIAGIGAGIQKKIEEIIDTGHLRVAENVKEGNRLFEDLCKIYGVGPAKAKSLISSGVTSVQDLRAKQHLLHENQKVGLLFYDDFLERIPREEMKKHETYIKNVVKRVAAGKEHLVTIVGSYRRGKSDSGDIDVLICFPKLGAAEQVDIFKKIVAAMRASKYMTHTLAEGDHKCLAVSKLVRGVNKHRRLDLLLTPESEYAYALLYFTGSDVFNIQCRIKAKEKGYSLSEHGLKVVDAAAVPPMMSTEKQVLEFIGMKYVAPARR